MLHSAFVDCARCVSVSFYFVASCRTLQVDSLQVRPNSWNTKREHKPARLSLLIGLPLLTAELVNQIQNCDPNQILSFQSTSFVACAVSIEARSLCVCPTVIVSYLLDFPNGGRTPSTPPDLFPASGRERESFADQVRFMPKHCDRPGRYLNSSEELLIKENLVCLTACHV